MNVYFDYGLSAQLKRFSPLSGILPNAPPFPQKLNYTSELQIGAILQHQSQLDHPIGICAAKDQG
jgi:hypothetical protein